MGTSLAVTLSPANRARRISRVLWVTLALNWGTAFLEILFGWMTHTMVIYANGFHSLTDGTSNIVALIGVWIASHPADHDHPYGHEKFETLASIVISMFLLAVSIGIFQKAWNGFFHPVTPEVTVLSFALMTATLCVNLFVVWYERREARALNSELLLSDSWHTMTDVFVTLGVLAALAGISLKITLLDPLVSLAIAAVIAWAAFQILKQSSDILADKAVLDPAEVSKIVCAVEGVRDCHEVRTRGKSHLIYVDLHALVDPSMSVDESHGVANRIEHRIKKEIPGVYDVVVHIEPTTHDHSELKDERSDA